MHIAFILDGNRRWAKSQKLPKFMGHKKGLDKLEDILKLCVLNPEIKFITAYALSTENMNREVEELHNLFDLIEKFAKKWPKFVKWDIKVLPIGDHSALPISTQNALNELKNNTDHCQKLIFAPAVHYGGRDEIIRTINKILLQNHESVSQEDFEQNLDIPNMPPVDLLIRTGGQKRLSNFLLWQCAYAELYFLDKMWPDFTEKDFENALEFYNNSKRNFGK